MDRMSQSSPLRIPGAYRECFNHYFTERLVQDTNTNIRWRSGLNLQLRWTRGNDQGYDMEWRYGSWSTVSHLWHSLPFSDEF